MTDDRPKKPLTEAQLRQRREAAAKSTGPRTPAGKAASSRNAWKTGEHSAAARLVRDNWSVGAFAKPCRTTCHQYPCSLVADGKTDKGGDCLDKTVYLQAFDRLLDSLQSGDSASMHDVLAAEAAGAIELLRNLREEISARSVTLEIPAFDKEGKPLMVDGKPAPAKVIPNPAVNQYIALLDRLGINLPELLATPRAAAKSQTDDDAVDAVAELFGRVAEMGFSRRRPVTIDSPDDEPEDQ